MEKFCESKKVQSQIELMKELLEGKKVQKKKLIRWKKFENTSKTKDLKNNFI